MSIESRVKLYRAIEAHRGRPLVVYVTSTRVGQWTCIAQDALHEMALQLRTLPDPGPAGLDLIIMSWGGDPRVAWQLVSLIRQQFERLHVLIPASAASTATMVALGADSIAMHPGAHLGPIDNQAVSPKRAAGSDGPVDIAFGSEDLINLTTYARDELGMSEVGTREIVEKYVDQVTPTQAAAAVRNAKAVKALARRLLASHLKDAAVVDRIIEKLTHDLPTHGYPITRSEALELGLPVEDRDPALEGFLWDVYADFVQAFELRSPWNPLELVAEHPECAPLFAPAPVLNAPIDAPDMLDAMLARFMAERPVQYVPHVRYRLLAATVESARLASHNVCEGFIVAGKKDGGLTAAATQTKSGWVTVEVPPP